MYLVTKYPKTNYSEIEIYFEAGLVLINAGLNLEYSWAFGALMGLIIIFYYFIKDNIKIVRFKFVWIFIRF